MAENEKSSEKRRIWAYCRVSTLSQTNQPQIESINKYCLQNDLKLTDRIESMISSRKSKSVRLSWIDELSKCDILIVAELSRLGRSLTELIMTINQLKELGVELHIIDRGLILGQEDNLQSTITLTIFSLLAEIERDLISQRTKRGLEASSKKGGRPRETKHDTEALSKALNSPLSVVNASRQLGIPESTVRHLIKAKYVLKCPVNNTWHSNNPKMESNSKKKEVS